MPTTMCVPPPAPPVTPYHGANITADYMRLGVIILAFIVLVECAFAFWDEIRADHPDGHRVAFHYLVGASVLVALGTEWGRLGHVITWRLPMNMSIILVAVWAMWWRLPWMKNRRTKRDELRDLT